MLKKLNSVPHIPVKKSTKERETTVVTSSEFTDKTKMLLIAPKLICTLVLYVWKSVTEQRNMKGSIFKVVRMEWKGNFSLNVEKCTD